MPEAWEMQQRRYSIAGDDRLPLPSRGMVPSTSEDLHAWSIYRQNLNSDFTDSALGSSEKSPLPYGNFQLRESTVHSILNHPRYGPKSPLGANMYTYLKFGLPRVFPPNHGPGGTSSGYNSSEEGGQSKARGPRSKSEADFNILQYNHNMQTLGGKSLSHADLLSAEKLMRQSAATHRRSLHDLRHTEYLHHALIRNPQPMRQHPQHPAQRRRASVVKQSIPQPESFFTTLRPHQYTGLYPHLQVRNLNLRNNKGETILNNLSTEVKAGEILAVMSTSSDIGTSLLKALAGRNPYSGQVAVNGQLVRKRDLRGITSMVFKDSVLHRDLTVSNCLKYYASLKRPRSGRGKLSKSDQVAVVTDELGLCPVLDTLVSKLTQSEYSRLLVALELLADPQILLVDDVTQPMDIFDTFFLIEFLRHWAAGATGGVAGRIVVMCLQPPTFEILTMVSRLVILSGCDTMYDGPSRALASYFTPVQCPAPAFKNPADYYLDLVTLDDLSAEAMLESSQRVDQLASLYRRRQKPLSESAPYTLPDPFRRPGIFDQVLTLLLKDAYYSQPVNFTRWIARLIASALVSVIVGTVFWDIPATDPTLSREDRLGYHFTVIFVTSFPIVLALGLSKTYGKERMAVESDIRHGLYSRFMYILITILSSIIPSCLIWLAYLTPAYCMSGLYDEGIVDGFSKYIGETLLGLLCLQYSCTVIGFLSPGKTWASLFYTVLHMFYSISSSYPLHLDDSILNISDYIAVDKSYFYLTSRDHSFSTLKAQSSRLVCRNKHVQRQDIIVHLPCPVPNGTLALKNHGLYLQDDSSFAISIIWLAALSFLIILAFIISPCFYSFRKKKR